jgi:hypothetical protein
MTEYEDIDEGALQVMQTEGALAQIERANVDMQITTAKRFPRNIQRAKKKMIELATIDQETAQSCFFCLPRSGKDIQGESVRLAEIALHCFGNSKAGTRVIDVVESGSNPHVMVQAVAFDLENNVCVTIEKRRRITKKKFKDAVDEDDINLAVNACSAIAYRDCVFKMIPKALIKPVYQAAVKMATGGEKPIESRIANAIEQFSKMGVFEDRVLSALDKSSREELGQDDLVRLIGYFTAIRDGESTIEACFPKTPKASPLEDKKEATTKEEATDTTPETTKQDTKQDPFELDINSLSPSALIAAINTHKAKDCFAETLSQFGATNARELTDDQKKECLASLIAT